MYQISKCAGASSRTLNASMLLLALVVTVPTAHSASGHTIRRRLPMRFAPLPKRTCSCGKQHTDAKAVFCGECENRDNLVEVVLMDSDMLFKLQQEYQKSTLATTLHTVSKFTVENMTFFQEQPESDESTPESKGEEEDISDRKVYFLFDSQLEVAKQLQYDTFFFWKFENETQYNEFQEVNHVFASEKLRDNNSVRCLLTQKERAVAESNKVGSLLNYQQFKADHMHHGALRQNTFRNSRRSKSKGDNAMYNEKDVAENSPDNDDDGDEIVTKLFTVFGDDDAENITTQPEEQRTSVRNLAKSKVPATGSSSDSDSDNEPNRRNGSFGGFLGDVFDQNDDVEDFDEDGSAPGFGSGPGVGGFANETDDSASESDDKVDSKVKHSGRRLVERLLAATA